MFFIIKFYVQNNILKHIKKKHGQDLVKVLRNLEQMKTKFAKLDANIVFINLCKKEQLIPTFTKVKVSIQNGPYKLKGKITRLVMETELQNKHQEKLSYERTFELLTDFLHVYG